MLATLLGMSTSQAITFVIDEVNNVVGLPGVLPGMVILCEGAVVPCVPPGVGGTLPEQPGVWSDQLIFDPNATGSLATLISDQCSEVGCPPADLIPFRNPDPLLPLLMIPEVVFTFGGSLWDGAIYTPLPGEPGFLAGPDLATYVILSDVVPVPAAAWLFGSALGLMGLRRRKVRT